MAKRPVGRLCTGSSLVHGQLMAGSRIRTLADARAIEVTMASTGARSEGGRLHHRSSSQVAHECECYALESEEERTAFTRQIEGLERFETVPHTRVEKRTGRAGRCSSSKA